MADADKITRAQLAARLKQQYPQLSKFPDDDVVSRVLERRPDLSSRISGDTPTLTGLHAGPMTAKAKGYTTAYGLADWIKKNADVIGGTLGGAAGLPGGPLGAAAGATLGGASGRALQNLLAVPEGKGKTSSLGAAEDIALGGLEQGGYELAGAGLGRLGKAIKPASRAQYLAFGAKAGELGTALNKLMPEFDKTLAQTGVKAPKTIGALGQLVGETGKRLEGEFGMALGPIAGHRVLPIQVAQAIQGKITPNMMNTPEGRMTAGYLRRRAVEFVNKTWSIGELNSERELISKRLRAWHAAEASGQAAQSKVQAHIAADTAAEETLKDLLYDIADRSGSKPPGYFRELKRRQSELKSLNDIIGGSKEKLTKEYMESKGGPLSSKLHLRGYVHPQATSPSVIAGVSPSAFSSPMKQSSRAIQEAFPGPIKTGIRSVRSAVGMALSQRDIDALPIRALFGDYSQPEETQP